MRAEEVLRRYIDEDLPEFVELKLTDVNQRGNFGNTPLHVASVRGDLEEVEALLAAGARLDAKGELGNTPLHDAIGQGHVEVVERLLEAGAPVDVTNDDGETPRGAAAIRERYDILAVIDDYVKRKR